MTQTPFAPPDLTEQPPSRQEPARPSHRQEGAAVRRRFDTLLRKITDRRSALAEWQSFREAHLLRCAKELAPLQARHRAARLDVVQALDRAARHPELGRGHRHKISALLCDYLEDLLAQAPDTQLLAMYEQHAGQPYRGEAPATDWPPEDLPPPGAPQDSGREPGSPEDGGPDSGAAENGSPQGGSPKRGGADSGDPQHALRALYRRLAFALHPDRESDPQQHARKTEAMQQLNQAYQRADLLTLLELQQALADSGTRSASRRAEKPLHAFVVLLEDQLRQLQQELEECISPLRAMLNTPPRGALRPAHIDAALREDLRSLREGIQVLNAEAVRLRDVQDLKRRLKHYRIGQGRD